MDAEAPPAAAAVAAGDSAGGGGSEPAKGAGGDHVEEFVADFGIPEGLVAPATVRQHMMMVGTARTAVRSPQVQYKYTYVARRSSAVHGDKLLLVGRVFLLLSA